MKQTFTLLCLILATIIGAGFASGKEVQIFFSRFGIVSFLSVIVAFVLFYFLIKTYLSFGNKFCCNNFFELNKKIFKNYNFVFNLFFVCCYVIVLAGMFAGVYEVYSFTVNHTLSTIFVLVTAILCAIENSGGIKFINFVNNIFIPITMVGLIVVSFFSFNSEYSLTLNFNFVTSFKSLVMVCLYVGINILLSGSVLIQEGCKYNLKSIKLASFYSSLILCFIIALFNYVIILNSVNTNMPMLTLAFNNGNLLGIVVLFCIWFCIYSAITSLTYALSGYFIKLFKSGFISNLFVITISYVISLLGFTQIVEVLYPIIGVLGVLYSFVIFINYKKGSLKK